MADFSAVLKRTIEGLGDTSPSTRQRVYDKARQTIRAKLAASNTPMTGELAQRQMKALEDAIETVEFDFRISDAVTIAPPQPARPSPFASPRPVTAPPAVQVAPPAPRPAPAAPSAAQRFSPPPSRPAPSRAEPAPAYLEKAPDAYRAQAPAEESFENFDAGVDAFDSPPEKTIVVRRRGGMALAVAAVAFFLVAGGGAAAWIYKDKLGALLSAGGTSETATASEPAAAPDQPADEAAGSAKFTQRMTEEGKEVDDGPAGGGASVGEGTSVAAATQLPGAAPGSATDATGEAVPQDQPAAAAPADQPLPSPEATAPPVIDAPTAPVADATTAPPQPGAEAGVAVSQKAIFYEERTNSTDGSANPGAVIWTLAMESPGGDLPPEPTIRAEATMPERNMKLRMTIRRNGDKTLPASHIVELVLSGPENPASGAIDNILRMTFKENEGATGSPLFGVPAKIADGFFLIALTDSKAEVDANVALMKREQWIDIPFVYGSGRRALITLEKGVPGEKVFEEALKAWEAKASG